MSDDSLFDSDNEEGEESEDDETEAERRERIRRTEQEADLKHAEDLFGTVGLNSGRKAPTIGAAVVVDSKDPTNTVNLNALPLFNPQTKKQFEQMRTTLAPIISGNGKKAHYGLFLEEFVRELAKEMNSDQVKKVASALTRLSNEKMKEEKAAEKGADTKPGEAALMSDEYYIAAAAKRRGLGLVQFIGELYKLGMLTERIMHECVHRLVDYKGVPDEAEIESLSKLLRTIGANLDQTEKGRPMMDAYFQRIQTMVDLPDLPSRLKFMLMDVVDLRRANWHSKEANKGPKTLEEVRAEVSRIEWQMRLQRQVTDTSPSIGGGCPSCQGPRSCPKQPAGWWPPAGRTRRCPQLLRGLCPADEQPGRYGRSAASQGIRQPDVQPERHTRSHLDVLIA